MDGAPKGSKTWIVRQVSSETFSDMVVQAEKMLKQACCSKLTPAGGRRNSSVLGSQR